MNFVAGEIMPTAELASRHRRCRELLAAHAPEAQGLLVFSRTNIYYLTGSMGNGMFWLPLEGEPVLMVRKGSERCRLESPCQHIFSFKSYSEIPRICAEAGSPLGVTVAAEQWALPWSLADMLQQKLKETRFMPGDDVLARLRAIKSPWELAKLREAGRKHAQALHELLPPQLHAGMTERDVAHALWDIFLGLGHCGMLRMGHHGEEIFLGRIAAGDNGNYPGPFNGPVGLKGEHAALPFMGYAGSVWRKGQALMVDTGFLHEGYHTDMSVTYWAGGQEQVPDLVRRAQACCAEVAERVAEQLRPGEPVVKLWERAQELAGKAGFAPGFMGLGGNKVPFVGHGIGLAMDEWPAVAATDAVLEENMVLALEPKIGLEGVGMVGVEEVYVVTRTGGECLTGNDTALCCVED